MKRRPLLIGLTTTAFAGCLSRNDYETSGTQNDGQEYEWHHDVMGSVSHVSNGRVFGHESKQDEDSDGGIFALDAETGDHLWTYGEVAGYDSYSDIAIEDALYVGYGDDAVGSGNGYLAAVEFDGEERWKSDIGSIYSRPCLGNGMVSVGNDRGAVYALDTATGEQVWTNKEDFEASPWVAAVTDVVYVNAGEVLALDSDDGSVKWSYGTVDDSNAVQLVEDGVVFVNTNGGVAAVADGDARWTVKRGFWMLRGIAQGHVIFQSDGKIHALDPATGEEQWVSTTVEGGAETWPEVVLHEDRVYVLGVKLQAFDADDGSELWNKKVGDSDEARSLTVVTEDETDAEHAMFVQTTDTRLDRVSSTGEVTWTEILDARITSYVVDDFVYVGTKDGIYSLDPR